MTHFSAKLFQTCVKRQLETYLFDISFLNSQYGFLWSAFAWYLKLGQGLLRQQTGSLLILFNVARSFETTSHNVFFRNNFRLLPTCCTLGLIQVLFNRPHWTVRIHSQWGFQWITTRGSPEYSDTQHRASWKHIACRLLCPRPRSCKTGLQEGS